jgi:hypothetical protein
MRKFHGCKRRRQATQTANTGKELIEKSKSCGLIANGEYGREEERVCFNSHFACFAFACQHLDTIGLGVGPARSDDRFEHEDGG